MSSRYWVFAVAFGLSVVASGLAGQDAADHGDQKEDTNGSTADQESPADPFSIPVRIIEDEGRSEARESSEEYSRNLQERDLVAQEGMNHATQSIEVATWYMFWASVASTVFVAIGTWLLVWNLRLIRQANQAAWRAVEVTREIGEKQTRPYIVFDHGTVRTLHAEDKSGGFVEVDIAFLNGGATPGVLTEATSAVYAPTKKGGWGNHSKGWRPLHVVIGPNQTGKVGFQTVAVDEAGNFSWFTIGILIFYESLSGSKFEGHVWLTFNGRELRQDYHHQRFALHRREESAD